MAWQESFRYFRIRLFVPYRHIKLYRDKSGKNEIAVTELAIKGYIEFIINK